MEYIIKRKHPGGKNILWELRKQELDLIQFEVANLVSESGGKQHLVGFFDHRGQGEGFLGVLLQEDYVIIV